MGHARFAPSAADRWAVCTASVEAEEQYEDQSSSYAQAGTEAHDLLERAIKAKVRPTELEPEHPATKDVSLCYDQAEIYLNDPRYAVFSELEVKLNDDIYGTVDIIILDLKDLVLTAIDYKNGFTLVEADTRQLQLYLKAAEKSLSFYLTGPVKQFRSVIVQPNAIHPDGPVRSEEYTVDALNDSVRRMVEATTDVKEGRTEFKPSEKGCRFCKHRANCSALADAALTPMGVKFQPVSDCLDVPDKAIIGELTPERKAAILEARPLFKMLLTAIEEDALISPPPGFKIVAGRSNRRLTLSAEELEEFLKGELKLKPSQYTEPKIVGIPALEGLIDKNARNGKKKWEKLQSIIEKPEGKPTVVSETDKRPAIAPMFQPAEDPLG